MDAKKYFILASITFYISADTPQQVVPPTAALIDNIEAVIFGQAGTEVVTKSDVMRPSLTGVQQSKGDIIFERLIYLDAQKFKMLMLDEDAIDKYLATVQRENNLTQDQMREIFIQAGYTPEEGREQFKRLFVVNQMLDFKIRSNLVVPRQQIEAYHKSHPLIEPESYQLQIGLVPYKDDRVKQKAALMQKSSKEKVEWNESFWIQRDDVAEEKSFIFSMKPGQVKIEEGPESFELLRLIEKKEAREVPLEERYAQIVDILRKPKYEELMNNYKTQLFDSVSILHLGD